MGITRKNSFDTECQQYFREQGCFAGIKPGLKKLRIFRHDGQNRYGGILRFYRQTRITIYSWTYNPRNRRLITIEYTLEK